MTMRFLALLLLIAGSASAQLFREDASNNRLVMDSGHLQEWDFPVGTLDFEGGTVRPNFVSKNIDATRDILKHLLRTPPDPKKTPTLRDAVEAGSNRNGVVAMIDPEIGGDWKPRVTDPLRDWWFQIDLGRMVSARKIVLRFPEEEIGDPFLQFAVLTSDGSAAFSFRGGFTMNFRQVFRTQKDNKDQRVFEIDLDPASLNGVGYEDDMIRFVQVIVTETDSTRAAQISATEYEALAASDKGVVDYFKRVAGGDSVRISQAAWEAVDPALRAGPGHYRRERPSLDAIEVWAEGENITLGIRERDGQALTYNLRSLFNALDGDFNTVQLVQMGEPGERRVLLMDLNAGYWIDTFLTFYDTQHQILHNYEVQTWDGSLEADGTRAWRTQGRRLANEGVSKSPYDLQRFAPVKAKAVQVEYWHATHGRTYSTAREIGLFGQGFQPEVTLETPLPITLDGSSNLVSIEWDAETPPGTALQIQTRTGNELAEEYHYFHKNGTYLGFGEDGLKAWDKAGYFGKGDVDTVLVTGTDWSAWSRPYTVSGEAITSPSPRRSLMLRAQLTSDAPDLAASLSEIRLNFVDPLASRFMGEIFPTVVEELGVEAPISVFIVPQGQTRDIDELLVTTTTGMPLEFVELLIGDESAWADSSVAPAPHPELIAASPDSLWLRLAEPISRGDAELIEIRFAATLFAPGVSFSAQVGNSKLADSWQRVDGLDDTGLPADATSVADGRGMVLLGNLGNQRVLSDVRVDPPVVTPNGDGANDHMTFAFNVNTLTGPQPVEVRIFDLTGRPVRQLTEHRNEISGRYAIEWGGEGEDGHIVPPGIYLASIDAKADSEKDVDGAIEHRVIQVAY